MKKKLLLAFALALLVPWTTRAQDCTQTVPYTEGFEGVTGTTFSTAGSLPACWNGFTNGTGTGYVPHVVTGAANYSYQHSGINSLVMTSGSGASYGNTKIVMLPPMSVALNQLQLSFWMCTESSSYGTLIVGYVTSDDTTTFTEIQSYTASSASMHSGNGLQTTAGVEVELNLASVPSNATRLAFKWYHNSTYYTCCIDDVVISYPPTCPKVDSLTVSPTSNSAEVAWVSASNATSWVIVVSDATGVVDSSIVMTNPATVYNLTPNTAYDVTVRAICGDEDWSLPRSTTFRTACSAVATEDLPWTYGFEDATGTSGTSTFNTCLGRHVVGSTTNYPYPTATHHGTGSKGLYMYSTASAYSWLVLPMFEEDLTDLYLSFYAYRSTTATYGHWAVGVMSNPEDITTFDTIAQGQVSRNSNWDLIEVSLANYTGNGQFLAILCPISTGTNYTYIDDITVGYPPACPTPGDFATSNAAAHSIDLSWTSNASEFIVEYGRQDFVQGTGDSLTVYSNTVTLDNLVMGAKYDAFITAVCGSDTSHTLFGSFSTGCEALTENDLPYFEDFESYGTGSSATINSCWKKGTNYSSTAYPYPYSTAAINGVRGLYFYSTSSYYSWAAMPAVDENVSMNTLQVEFPAKRYSSTSTTYKSVIWVGIAESVDALYSGGIDTLVTWIDTIDLTPLAVSAIQNNEVSFANYTGEGRYVVFYAPKLASGTNNIYIDDINLMLIPSCYRPTALRVDEIQANEVTLSWSPDPRTLNPSSWLVEYGPEGFLPGEGMYENAYDTTITISGLESGTRYEFRVSADCGSTVSDPRPIALATMCDPLTLPYYENFDNMAAYSTGDGTDMIGGAPLCWDVLGHTGSYIALYSTAAYLYGGSGYSIKFKSGTANTPNYLILPNFEMNISNLELAFQTRPEGTSASAGAFEVGYMTNPLIDTTFVAVEHYSYDDFSGAYEQRIVTFPEAPDGARIAMRHIPTGAGWFWFVDEIDVHSAPTCTGPQDIAITACNNEEATLVISDSNHVNNYIITLTVGDSLVNTITSTTDTNILTDLTENTLYRVTVVTDCDDGTYTAALSTNFRTACNPVASTELPYVEDFENYTSGAANPISTCWTKGVFGTTTQYPYPLTTAASTGGMGLYGYGAAAICSYAALPLFETSIDQLTISFYMKRYGTASYQSRVLVGVMSNPNDTSTFEPLEDIDITSENPSSIHRINVSFLGYEGNGHIALFFPKATNGASYNGVYIDSVVVDNLPTCVWPNGLAVDSVTPTSVTLSWNGNASSYEVQYSRSNDFATIAGTTTVATTTATVSSLNNYTQYYFRVRSLCGAESSLWTMPVAAATLVDCGVNSINIVDTIGDGTSSSGTYTFYTSTTYRTGFSSSIYTVQELNAMGLQTNNRINGIKLHSGATGGTIRKAKVYVKEVSLEGFSTQASSDTVDRATMTLVYSGDLVVPANSWVEIPFDSVFPYSGTSNLLVNLYHDTTTTASVTFYYTNTTPAYLNCYGYRSTATAANNSATRTTSRPNMLFNMCTEIPDCVRPTEVAAAVGDTAITLSWVGNANNYEVVLSTASCNPDTATGVITLTTNTNSATIGGLEPTTTYYYYVRSLCGGLSGNSEWSIEGSATTACMAKALPYTENFESYTSGATNPIDPCWTKGTNNSTAYPYPYSTNAVSGERSLYFYGYRSSTTTYYSYAALPLMQDSVKNLSLSFNVRRYSTITDGYTTRLVIGVMTDPADIATFFPMDTLDLKTADALSVHGYEFFFNNYTGDGQYIAIYDAVPPLYGTATTCYSYAYVDDILVDHIPSCVRPTNVVASTIGETTATLHWTSAAANFDIEYGPRGFNHGAGTTLTSTADSIVLTGLTQGTTYDVYVRAHCSATDMSAWSFAYTFVTECGVNPLPYTEDFERYGSGAAFTIDPCWVKGTNSTTAYPYPYSTNAVTGNRSLYFYATTSSNYYSYAALPLMADSVKNLMLSFNVRRYGTVGNTYTTRLVIGVMTDPNDITTFFPMDTLDLQQAAASSIHGYEYCFSNYTGNGQYIAIYDAVPPTYGGTSSTSYAYVDDIVVDHIPSCLRPTDVTITNITDNSATVRWTGNAPSYEIEYGPQGFNRGMGFMVTSNTDSIDLVGLQNSTNYDVYVRGICSAADQSEWSFVRSFATTCGPNALPMLFDPDNFATGTATPLPLCWTRTNNATGTTNYYPYIFSSSANAHSGTNVLYYYFYNSSSYANDELMAFPEVDTVNFPMNTVEVSFWAKSSVAGKPFMVGVMTDPTNVSTFQVVDTITLTTTSSEYFVEFTNFTGNGSYVALRGVMEGTSSYYIYVDDIAISTISACPRVSNLTAYNATATSATLEWEDTVGYAQWVVSYAIDTAANWTEVSANSNPFVLTGLTPNTLYRYRVAPICPNGMTADWSREVVRFTTSQVPATVPYSYNFEDAAEWNNWQTSSNNTVNWYRGNVARNNNTNAMYLSADNGATHSWNMNAVTNAVAYRDIDFGSEVHSYQLDFDAYFGGTIAHNYDGIAVVLTDPATPVVSSSTGLTSPWGHVNNVSMGTIRHDTLWGQHTIYLDGVSGVKRLAFYHFNQATGANHPYENNPSAIDNISITLQTCERPGNLATIGTTTNSAQITWTGNATDLYQVAYRVKGTSASTNMYQVVAGTSATLTGLTSATNYYWWVRHICTLTETDTLVSSYAGAASFVTACNYEALPYTEGFEDVTGHAYNVVGELPSCWESYTDGTAEKYAPHVVDSGTYANYPHTGTHCLGMVSGSSAEFGPTKVAVLPRFAAAVNTLHMKFWYKMESATSGTLTVGYVTDLANIEGSYHSIHTVTSSTTLTQDSVSFESVPANALQIAFRWYQNGTWYTVGIDDIEVWSTAAACVAPGIDTVIVTENTIEFNWEGATAQTYQVAAVAGAWTEPVNPTTITGYTHTFTGLTPETQYTIGVRAVCAEGLYSDWTYRTVTTDIHPCAVPTALNATDVTFNSAILGWTAEEGQTAWQIHVSGEGMNDTLSVTTNPYTLNGLANGVTYTFEVRGVCSATNMSDWSTPQSFTTTTCGTPGAPTVGNVTAYNATISWTAPANASGNYELEYGLSGFSQGYGTLVPVTGATTTTLTDLTPSRGYDVYVRSICATGVYSGWSTVANFQTSQVDTSATYYTVSATVNDPLMGIVTGTGTYEEGATATLTAIANTGYHFVSWNTGDTTASISFTVTADVTYTATFAANAAQQYTITAVANDPTMGTVTGSGIYDEGTTVTLAASPNTGYHFVNWNTGATTASITITVTEDATYTANFEANDTSLTYYMVTANVNDSAMGSVYGGGEYAEGTTATLTAVANAGYRFVNWNTGDTARTISFTVTEDVTYTATFEALPTYTLTVTVNDATMGRVEGIPTEAVAAGTVVRLTAVANDGYRFVNWSTGETTATISVTVNSDMSLMANFQNVGIDEVANAKVNLYPNPATTMVTLTGIEGMATVTVVDMNGRVVTTVETQPAASDITIDVTGFAQGAYFIRIVGEQVNAIRKLIVR